MTSRKTRRRCDTALASSPPSPLPSSALTAVHVRPARLVQSDRQGRRARSPFAADASITVSGAEIPNGTVVISGGKITAVGANVTVPGNAQVIDATGMIGLSGNDRDRDRASACRRSARAPSRRSTSPRSARSTRTRRRSTASTRTARTSASRASSGSRRSCRARRAASCPGTAALMNLAGDTPPKMAVMPSSRWSSSCRAPASADAASRAPPPCSRAAPSTRTASVSCRWIRFARCCATPRRTARRRRVRQGQVDPAPGARRRARVDAAGAATARCR